jgi:acyl-CoA synthetase (AMP-forming)/AMP-acid ligase II
MNIVEPILFHCKAQSPMPAMCAPGHALPLVSYGRLEQFIYNVARNARAQGLGPGNVAALLIEEPILHAAFILGLAYLGVETVSVRSTDLPRELQIDAVIADKPQIFKPQVFKNAPRVILADMNWLAGDGRPMADHAPPAGDACRIVLTSGTTGEPKGVAFSHDMLMERIARHNWTFGSAVPACSRIFVDPGLGTAIGFLFWLYTLAKGGTVVVRGPDAVETMQAFILYNVQCMVASPAALAEFVGYYESAPALTAPLDVVLSVGGLLPRSLSQRVRARICSNLIACYGSTEANIVATAPAHAIADITGAVGTITPGVTVGIVDGSGNTLPAGREGLIRISGRFTVAGYRGDADGARSAFRDGWFYPGDIGSLTADHLLVLTGREKAVLNLGGDKISPERIEQALASCAGLQHAAALAVPNAIGVEELVVAVVTTDFDADALRRHCERELPVGLVPARFIRLADIPRNDMGKVDRKRLADLVAKA